MRTIAAVLILAAGALAQEAPASRGPLTDPEAAALGAFAAERIDAAPEASELESSLRTRVEELTQARSSAAEKKDEAPKTRGKRRKKAASKSAAATPDAIKNGLTEADRVALGKFVAAELDAGKRGAELSGSLRKELERLRAERVKASSTASASPKKKKKRADS